MFQPDTTAFVSDKAALIVGFVGADGRPFATRGWGLMVTSPGDGAVRLLLEGCDRAAVAHLAGGGAVAITCADIETLYSVQMKGRVDGFEEPGPADLAHHDHYCDGYFGDIERVDHFERRFMEHTRPASVVVCRAVVEDLYDQTPGPAAGGPLAARRPGAGDR